MYNFLPINITDFKGMAKLHCIFALFQPLLARIDVIWEKQPLENKPALGPQCDSSAGLFFQGLQLRLEFITLARNFRGFGEGIKGHGFGSFCAF